MFIYRVIESFRKAKIEFAVAGGWAVAFHGAVRGTVDLDLVVTLTEKNLGKAEETLNKLGLESRPPVHAKEVIQFRTEYISNRNMMAWRFVNPSDHTEVVDILIVEDLKGIRVTQIKIGHKTIPVVSLPDLVRMKKRAGRPQDLEDVKALEALSK